MAANVFFQMDSWIEQFEGNSGVTYYVFTVMRDGDTTGASTVDWGVSPQGWGNLATTDDFSGATSGTLTFAAGVTSQTFTVDVLGDTTAEYNEDFSVYLQNASAGVTITNQYSGAEIKSDDDGIGATAGTAQALSVNGVREENIGVANDQDWYSLNLVAGTTYVLDMWSDFDGDTATLDPYLRLLNPGGTPIADNDNGGPGAAYGFSQIIYTATTTGTYYLSAQGTSGTGTYEVITSVFGQDDYTGTSIATTTASLSVTEFSDDKFGAIETAGDQDWFRVYLTVGQEYQLTDSTAGSVTTSLSLLDAGGTVLSSVSTADSNGEQSITYTAAASGDYYLKVQGTSGTGAYGLWVGRNNIDYSSPDKHFEITALSAPVQEGNGGVTPYVFQILRDGMSDQAASVSWTLAGSGANAANAADFSGGVLPTGTLNFAAGEAVKYITVNVVGDAAPEAAETFTITFSSPVGGTLADGYASAIGVIRNDDGLGTVVTMNSSFDMLAAQDWSWTVQPGYSSTQLITSDGVHKQEYNGSFSYDGSGNVSGTVSSTRYYLNNILVNSVTGMNANASQMQVFALTFGDTQQTYAYVLQGNDYIVGSSGNDRILGYLGNDTLVAGGGVDTLVGGSGEDTYVIDSASNVITELAAEGIDSIQTALVSYSLAGLVNVENLSYTGVAAFTGIGNTGANVLAGNSGNDSLSGDLGLDTLIGGLGDDTLRGGDQADQLYGGDGNDLISAGKGLDLLDGGHGNDTLTGGIGNDAMIGGAGIDTADYSTGSDGVTANLVTGISGSTVSIPGVGSGTDSLTDIENLTGSLFNDSLIGNTGNNLLIGLAGDDTLSGDDGFDTLDGGDGNDNLTGGLRADILNGGLGDDQLAGGQGMDTLDGGDGNDTLRGALGTDVLTGGLGADHFVFASVLDGLLNIDTLTDFQSGTDVIELSASVFGAFSGQVGNTIGLNANLIYSAGTGALAYDADGAGVNPALTFAVLGTSSHPATLGSDFKIVA